MDLPWSLAVGLVVVTAAVLVARSGMGRTSVLRRRVPGVILFGLGLALFGSQLPPTPERLLFGLAMLIAWGGTGVALIADRSLARLPGLAVSGVGFTVASWLLRRSDQWANEVGRSGDRVLVDVFFLADGPHFSWTEVGLAAMSVAVLSAMAGVLLLLPYPSSQPRS